MLMHLQEVAEGGQQRHRDQRKHLRARLGKGVKNGEHQWGGSDAFL